MSTPQKQFILRNLRNLVIWFLVITIVIVLYADDINPMPVNIFIRFLIAAGIVVFLNIPFVKAIGRIYLNTTPDDEDLEG
ncbi:hypothetical protein Q4560_09060 [Celeribacter halophilus]|uniref:hypothetical protein n=1 Tax=Celeribacter halophilus TaxID=576117 RepID=UPI0026E40E94|nr:hypothetical protein [Celeribacter halophilus]MDO6723413.1 hypothetical protein [Celeribacter halophilus]